MADGTAASQPLQHDGELLGPVESEAVARVHVRTREQEQMPRGQQFVSSGSLEIESEVLTKLPLRRIDGIRAGACIVVSKLTGSREELRWACIVV